MSEMALTAEHLVVIGRGRLIADVSMAERVGGGTSWCGRRAAGCGLALEGPPGPWSPVDGDALAVAGGLDPRAGIADVAARNGVAVHELTPRSASLEDAYLELTRNDVEYSTLPTTNPTDLRRVA